MVRFPIASLVSVFVVAATAQASVPPEALNAFHAGHFAKSAQIAEAEASVPSLAFAARALIAEAITRSGGFCLPCLSEAEALAQQVIALDAKSVEGHLQRAIAMGFRGRVIGVMQARSENLPEKAHDSLTKALELDPHSLWAQASLGAWNLEIVHHARPVLAAISYGATKSRGLSLYRQALARNSSNVVLHVHFALSILALDQMSFHDEAQAALAAALSVPTNDALALHSQNQARELQRTLRSQDPDALAGLVRRFQGYAS